MKLITEPCDISILTVSQAWENYCNALHIALVHRCRADADKYHRIAENSLNTYFRRFYEANELRMVLANERDPA